MSDANAESPEGKRPLTSTPSAFSDLTLSSHDVLVHSARVACKGGCGKKRRYFCSECVIPLVEPPTAFPALQLPLFVDILQAGGEAPQRSTAQHVPLLAPGYAKVWRPFPSCADAFRTEVLEKSAEGSVAILFPSDEALSPEEALTSLPNLKRIIVMDSSWTKSVLLMRDPCLRGLPHVSLPAGRGTRFWRYAPKRSEHSEYFNPDKVGSLLSTVESVHRFCDSYNQAKGIGPGACDDLLWLFAFLHGRVREVYENAPGKRQRIMRKSKGLLEQF